MSGFAEMLAEVGLRASDLVAGFLGGMSSVFFMRDIRPWQAVGSVFVGCVTAGYLSGVASKLLGIDLGNGGAASFVIGLTAMALCQGLISMVNKKFSGTTT